MRKKTTLFLLGVNIFLIAALAAVYFALKNITYNIFIPTPLAIEERVVAKNTEQSIKIEVPESVEENKENSAVVEEVVGEFLDLSNISTTILQEVPFTPQAPLGNWNDIRQQNACEEASALMAMLWVEGESFADLADAEQRILAITDYEYERYGHHHDVSVADTVERIFKGYFSYEHIELVENASVDMMIAELVKGNLIVAPVNGQQLRNPYFTGRGPREHMIVVVGYDPATKEFITHDPGTKRGANFRYTADALFGALRDYATGYHEPIDDIHKTTIVVKKVNKR